MTKATTLDILGEAICMFSRLGHDGTSHHRREVESTRSVGLYRDWGAYWRVSCLSSRSVPTLFSQRHGEPASLSSGIDDGS